MKISKLLPIRFVLLTRILFCAFVLPAQEPKWDDTKNKAWPDAFTEVEIPSTADGKTQKAMFRATTNSDPSPLIVSLHTWSGNYLQKDPLADQILEKDFNYIYPDFRGPNYTSEACGSPLVISDIDDAISYAIQNGHVDPGQIHIIGASGGAYATLLMYMQSTHQIKSFSAWVPISDIAKWYYESLGRKQKYAMHISLATTGDSTGINLEEAKKRSPVFKQTPVERRRNSKLNIYAGVHDGYKGSVPISHSMDMYNTVVRDFHPAALAELIPQQVREQLIISRNLPGQDFGKIGDRKIHYRNNFKNLVEITVFEGKHEMLINEALKF